MVNTFAKTDPFEHFFLWLSSFCNITALAHMLLNLSTSCEFVGRIRYTVHLERPAFGCVQSRTIRYESEISVLLSYHVIPPHSPLFVLLIKILRNDQYIFA